MKEIDCLGGEGPGVEESLFLRFVLDRGEAYLKAKNPQIPYLWWALCYIPVSHIQDLRERIVGLSHEWSDGSSEAVSEAMSILRAVSDVPRVDIPVSFLQRDRVPFGQKDCRKVLRYAYRVGRDMLEEQNWQFVPVWHVLGWIGLLADPPQLKEFESLIDSALSPEKKLKQGQSILRASLFSPRDAYNTRGA